MDKKENPKTAGLSALREDAPQKTDMEHFWENVPEHRDGYILTSRVEGV